MIKKINPLYIFIFITCFSIAQLHIKRVGIYSIQEFLEFKAALPFQARFLSYSIIRVLADLQNLQYDSQSVKNIFIFQEFFSLFVATIFLLKIYNFGKNSSQINWIIPIIFYWQLILMYLVSISHPYWFPYDITQIFFITLYWFGLRYNWSFKYLILIFIIGVFNRETMIVAAVFHWAYKEKKWFCKMLILSIIWLLIKATLAWIFRNHPGESVSLLHYEPYDQYLCDGAPPCEVPRYYRNLFLFINGGVFHVMVVFGFLWLVFISRWQLIPKPLQRMMLSFILFFAGMFFVGNIDEIRIFGEYIPIVTLSVASIIFHKSSVLNGS